MKTYYQKLLCSLASTLVFACAALAAGEGSQDQKIQFIKRQALELNRDLLILEEELLFPDDSRLAVYLSLDVGDFFPLDTVTLSIDGDHVTHHLYSPQELDALRLGGAQRLYIGNVKIGEHQIVATFTAKGPEDRDYRGKTELTLGKTGKASILELKISDPTERQQPEFSAREW